MSELVVALVGVTAGALASGGLQTYVDWQGRRREKRVAARLIAGDLLLAAYDLEHIARAAQWPDPAPDFDRLLTTWAEQREAFAAGVDSIDWNDVASVCRALAEVSQAFKPQERLSHDEVMNLRTLVAKIGRASEASVKHSTTRLERYRPLSA